MADVFQRIVFSAFLLRSKQGQLVEFLRCNPFSQITRQSEEGEEEKTSLNQKQDLVTCALTLLGEAWPDTPATQGILLKNIDYARISFGLLKTIL